uniref:Uncharacterized protein n=1 Tax=viral metagenome TaxID=1070528 RepID=A0A6C0LKE7_9ZZZZ
MVTTQLKKESDHLKLFKEKIKKYGLEYNSNYVSSENKKINKNCDDRVTIKYNFNTKSYDSL